MKNIIRILIGFVIALMFFFSISKYIQMPEVIKQFVTFSLIVSIIFLTTIWLFTYWRVYRVVITRDKFKQKELESEFIKTAIQILVGIAAIFGFTYTIIKDNEDHTLSRNQISASAFAEATKIMGASKKSNDEEESLDNSANSGAIYLLEKVATTDPSYLQALKYILIDYLKKNAKRNQGEIKDLYKISADLQAAIVVLGNNKKIIPYDERYAFTLDNLNLAGADFGRREYIGIQLRGSDLRTASFSSSIITNAGINRAEMNDDNAFGKNWNNENEKWQKRDPYEYATSFKCADLSNTSFEYSGMRGAIFKGANLDKTNFNHVDLSRVDFSNSKNLTSTIFLKACSDGIDESKKNKWPEKFKCKLPSCGIDEKERNTKCFYDGLTESEIKKQEELITKE